MLLRMALLLSGLAVGVTAVEAQNIPRFEVTSVKPNRLDPRRIQLEFSCSANGKFTSRGQSLRPSLLWAYNIKAYQLAGLPEWVDSAEARFDIEAETPAPLSEDRCRLMLQALLADRFRLAAHRESRTIPVYELVVAKHGPKFKQPASGDSGSRVSITVNGTPMRFGIPRGAPKDAASANSLWSMQRLADFLSAPPFTGGRPIMDRTGLRGAYAFSLDFSTLSPGGPRGDAPDAFEAVQDQLGLKLEDRKEPIEVLVIDHLERPDPN